METVKNSIKQEKVEIAQMFELGMLTAKQRFSLDFKADQALKMLNRIATN